jgi:DNA-binding transcriptional ArsR family regulator
LIAVADTDPFAALADPTRRQIVEMLAGSGPTTATALAGRLDISRQAVAKHLQLLAGAGIATSKRVGRETQFAASIGGFGDVRSWLDEVEGQWSDRLALLAKSLEGNAGPDRL